MQAYCREVVLVPNPYGREGLTKRLLQLRSLASTQSFERLRVTVSALQRESYTSAKAAPFIPVLDAAASSCKDGTAVEG